MAEFDPKQVNGYAFEELMGFIDKGVVNFEGLKHCYLNYEMQAKINAEFDRRKAVTDSEENAWRGALAMNTLQGFEMYVKKFGSQGIHAFEAEVKLEEMKQQKLKLYVDLYDDMRRDITQYKAPIMQYLFRIKTPTDSMLAEDSPKGRFLKAGLSLNYNDLIENGFLPPENKLLMESILKQDYALPQMQFDQLGEFPTDRTDIYFLGCPGSGKSCVLAGILNYLRLEGWLEYEVQMNDEGKDLCKPYFDALIEGVSQYKVPQSTSEETISFLKFNMGPKFDRRITAMELSGEAFNKLANGLSSGKEVWGKLGASRCLSNDSKKTLFFLLDYSSIIGKNPEITELKQALILENSLVMFSSDGEGPKGDIGCTMSKVETVAIVVTKSDLMDKEAGTTLSPDERAEIALKYLNQRFRLFMNNLTRLCKKYGINNNNKDRNAPFVTTFSLGRFYLGNSVVYEQEDSKQLAELIMACTDKERKGAFDFLH